MDSSIVAVPGNGYKPLIQVEFKKEIKRVVAEAEKYKAVDDAKKKVEAPNQLENFCHQGKNVANKQLGDKMSADDNVAIEKAAGESLSGLTRTRTHRMLRLRIDEGDDFNWRIVAKAYQHAGAAGGMFSSFPMARPIVVSDDHSSGISEKSPSFVEVD